jgi:uncharacterized protein YjiS (DUF1127 family)
MKKVYLATVIAIVITTSIASHLLAVGALGSTTPTFLTNLRSGIRGFFNRLGNFIDDWIAAMLAHRERQATIFMLNYLTDRGLKDIGLYRSNIVFDPRFSERAGKPVPATRHPPQHASGCNDVEDDHFESSRRDSRCGHQSRDPVDGGISDQMVIGTG